jgi:hypothetical protein
LAAKLRAFLGEVDPFRRQKMRHSKEESRFHDNGIGFSRTGHGSTALASAGIPGLEPVQARAVLPQP